MAESAVAGGGGRGFAIAAALKKPFGYFVKGVQDEDGDGASPPERSRLCIETARHFMRIKNSAHQDALGELIRKFANAEGAA
ncbi:MAG: hypothetical protein ABW189_01580 [Rickettsiales bacterium]